MAIHKLSKRTRAIAIIVISMAGIYLPLTTAGLLRNQNTFPMSGIISVNWYGVSEDYALALYDWNPIEGYAGRWQALIPKLKTRGFNTISLVFRAPGDSGPHKELDLDVLNTVLSLLSANGFKAVLYCHDATFGGENWKQCWLNIASRFKNDDRIVAFYLMNEPGNTMTIPSITTMEDAVAALTSLTDSIRALGDNHTIVYIDTVNFGGWKTIVVPSNLYRENIVISENFWTYGTPQTVADAIAIADYRLGRLLPFRDQGFKLWASEVGVYPSVAGGGPYEVEKTFAVYVINKAIEEKLGFSWWLYSMDNWIVGSADDCISSSNYMRAR